MNPLIPVLLLIGGAVIWSLSKTAKAAVKLNYDIVKFGIYKFASDGNMILRVRVRFGNLTNTRIHINMINLAAYYNPTYSESNGKLNVTSRGSLLASINTTNTFIIAANSIEEKDFFINIRWADVAMLFVNNITDIWSIINNTSGIANIIQKIVGKPVLINGQIKAENIIFKVEQIVTLTDERQ